MNHTKTTQTKRTKDYATESAHAMALLAFMALSAKKLEIYCDSANIASTKIPLKLCFKLEYIQRGGWTSYDEELDELQTYYMFHATDLPNIEVV